MNHQVQLREGSIRFGALGMWHFANDRESDEPHAGGHKASSREERREDCFLTILKFKQAAEFCNMDVLVFFCVIVWGFLSLHFVLPFQRRAVPSTGE